MKAINSIVTVTICINIFRIIMYMLLIAMPTLNVWYKLLSMPIAIVYIILRVNTYNNSSKIVMLIAVHIVIMLVGRGN